MLCVSLPSGGLMLCTSIYPACEILIRDATLYVNLLPLEMGHFDIILGMGWLTKYYVTIDCVLKWVILIPETQ